MSIQAMKKRFVSRFGKWILYFLALVFIITLPALFSPSGLMSDRDQSKKEERPGASDPVSKVNGQTLTRADLDAAYQQSLGQMQAFYAQVGGSIGVERLWTFRVQALGLAINNELIRQEAVAKGLQVSKSEVGKKIDDSVNQEVEMLKFQGKGRDLEKIYAQVASQIDGQPHDTMSEGAFRGLLNDLFWEKDRPRVEMEIMTEKLKAQIAPLPPISEPELLASYDSVTPREVTVNLKRPGRPDRTDAEARKRAEELLAQIRGGADFTKMAREQSDDAEVKMTGGVREPMLVRNMDPDWLKAVAPLPVGQVSEPIRTPYGYLLIKVEKRARQLPPDFERNKQEELKRFATQRQSRAWEQYTKQLRAKAQVELVDLEMKGYQALREGKVDEGLGLLKKAVEDPARLGPAGAASAYYQIATYLASRNNWKEAAEYYAYADDYLSQQRDQLPGARVQTLLGLGRSSENLSRIYQAQGKTKEAKQALDDSLSWYQVASEQTDIPSFHEQLKTIYTNLKQPQLVAQEQQWLDEYKQAEAEKAKAYEAQQKAMEKGTGQPQRPLGPAPTPAPAGQPAPTKP